MKKNIIKHLFVLSIAGISIFAACKKGTPTPETPTTPTTPSVTGTRDELTKDSIFLYSKELYYWNTSLPAYDVFKPRSYSSNEAELFAITQFSINPDTGKPYEYVSSTSTTPKYSFFDYGTTGKTSALKADVNGTETDYGFSVSYNTTTDLRVKYVYPNSPASQQGLTRGCRLTSVNGRTSLTYTSSNVTFLNDALFGTAASVSLTFIDLAGTTKTVTVNRATYTVNPILFTNVYTAGTKKVGYIVFNSFTNNASAAIGSVFSNFASQGVTEVVVDLRYNGGGYVSTATQIINILSPTAQTGKTMFSTYYNSYLQNLTTAQRKASVLAHQPLLDDAGKLQTYTTGVNGKYATYADLDYSATSSDNVEKFAKSGSLNLSRVYFIVTGSTASASELTINSLKPVMDVKLIGTTTYGKPVGFFPIRIDKVDMYIPEFETKNQAGTGGYYAGLTADKEAYEDLTKAWGDESETLLAYALLYAKTGSFVTTPGKTGSLSAQSAAAPSKLSIAEVNLVSDQLDQNSFKGMVYKPHRKF
ncbi:S41 family peptidase [Pedobacter rhodius]|uniref:S41 family peptidase n=1 Tax=Pedobacter rhodius TaxID=3004098 RepID=A0ABT4KTB7_9SPHI|nr:S41 family peptidase [Pedobacter sp. SJ11]MCZ4221971.1 S41 family peptidase [Pedobacter sp. SJ11]